MYAQLFSFLLFVCQIILNESSVIHENTNSVISSTSAPARPVTLPEGYVRFPEDHVAYKIHKEDVLWEVARERCIAEGGHLAIADTVGKIKNICSTVSEVENWIAVGIQFSEASNTWVRIDNGLSLTTLPWKEGTGHASGNCVGISFDGETLVNYDCNELSGDWYACEISI